MTHLLRLMKDANNIYHLGEAHRTQESEVKKLWNVKLYSVLFQLINAKHAYYKVKYESSATFECQQGFKNNLIISYRKQIPSRTCIA